MKKLLLFGASALLMASLANASIIFSLNSGPTAITTGPNTGDFDYIYNLTLSTDQNFRGTATTAGETDFTSIIDFGGFVSDSFADAADDAGLVASLSTQLTGPGSPPAGGTDSASILNIVLRDTGTTVMGSAVTGAVGDLGLLTVVSTSGTLAGPTVGSFSSQGQKAFDGTTSFNQGFLPVPTVPTTSTVPEPMTFSLMGAGLVGLVIARRRSLKNRG